MGVTRRGFMKVLGGGVLAVSAVAAAGGTYVMTRDIGPATQPWREAGQSDDPRLWVLSHAILAPNPHNMQPWLLELTGLMEMMLHADPDRLLPETDPYARQIVIGLGCFLELARLAAAEKGFRLDVDLFPDGSSQTELGDRPVARMRLVEDPSIKPDPLFAHVFTRRSNKEPYDTGRAVSAEHIKAIASVGDAVAGVQVIGDDDANRALREITTEGYMVEGRTPHLYQESINVMRIGAHEVNANPDGIEIHGPMIEALKLVGGISREHLRDPNSQASQVGADMLREACMTAMGQVIIVTQGNSREEQVATGRVHLRANLTATALGVGMHPNSQTLQEDPVFADLQAQVHEVMEVPRTKTIQMLSRIGYGPDIQQTPRWPLEARLRS